MPEQTVEFRSKYSNHVLTRVPRIEQVLATGIRQVVQNGESVKFTPVPDGKGGLEGRYVARVGRNVHHDSYDWLAPGQDGDTERDEVDALKAHREFGKEVWVAGWSPAETRQLPRPQDFRREVIAASALHDTDAIQALLDKEMATHGRGDLVQVAQDALAAIEELRAAAPGDNAQNAPGAKEKK